MSANAPAQQPALPIQPTYTYSSGVPNLFSTGISDHRLSLLFGASGLSIELSGPTYNINTVFPLKDLHTFLASFNTDPGASLERIKQYIEKTLKEDDANPSQ